MRPKTTKKELKTAKKTKTVRKRAPKKTKPEIQLDYSALNAMLQFKVTLDYCADYLGCSHDTIQRRLKKDFGLTFTQYHNLKLARTNQKLQQKLLTMALNGDKACLIFACKNFCGFSDNPINDEVQKREINITYGVVKKEKDDEQHG